MSRKCNIEIRPGRKSSRWLIILLNKENAAVLMLSERDKTIHGY
jgi:hypothetical protein